MVFGLLMPVSGALVSGHKYRNWLVEEAGLSSWADLRGPESSSNPPAPPQEPLSRGGTTKEDTYWVWANTNTNINTRKNWQVLQVLWDRCWRHCLSLYIDSQNQVRSIFGLIMGIWEPGRCFLWSLKRASTESDHEKSKSIFVSFFARRRRNYESDGQWHWQIEIATTGEKYP